MPKYRNINLDLDKVENDSCRDIDPININLTHKRFCYN